MDNREKITDEMRETIKRYKNIVVSGEVGVGKITHTVEAVQDNSNVYYLGNPVDYVGKPRPKGYDKYIDYIISLKKDMRIIATEKEILSFDFSSIHEDNAILIIDEIYGRSAEQFEKVLSLLGIGKLKVIIIAGCLKNVGRLIRDIDAAVMLIPDGILLIEKEFAKKICSVLGPDPHIEQVKLFN